jgi:uncharacterized membrane protein YqjE
LDATPDPLPGKPDGSVRGAGEALAGLLGTRLELVGIELREEILYLQRVLILGIVAAFLLGGALVVTGGLIAAAFWDTYRLPALGAVALLYVIVAAICLLRVRSSLQQRSLPFDTTVRELEADLRALRETSGSDGA